MKYVPIAVLVLLLCGCSTLTQGVDQDVAIVTPGVEGAACAVKGYNGQEIATTLTPGSVRLQKSRRAIDVTCEKPGYQRASTTISSAYASRSRIQHPVGYVVDGVSGAMWNYPPQIVLQLVPESGKNARAKNSGA